MKRVLALMLVVLLIGAQCVAFAEQETTIDPELSEIASEFLKEGTTTLTSAVFDEIDNPKDDVDITVTIGLCWNEDDIVRTACDYAVQTMQKIWGIQSVEKIFFFFDTKMMDQYGNKTMDTIITLKVTRDGTEKVNYENFIPMVHGDYNFFLQLCDSVAITRSIHDKLKLVNPWN